MGILYHLCGFDIIPRNAIVYDMHFETAILCVDIVTPRACIRGLVRQSVLSVVVCYQLSVVVTKIARSRVLHICV